MTKLHGITAAEFDQRFPIGSTFKYFPIIRHPEFEEVTSRSVAWALGHGAVVVSVTGRSGGVSVEHLEPVSIAAAPALIVRDSCGFWTHPATPDFDEGTPTETYEEYYASKGIEVKGHYIGADSQELEERCGEGDEHAVSQWIPTPPEGYGWFLWSIFDTEDGPYCEFARRLDAHS